MWTQDFMFVQVINYSTIYYVLQLFKCSRVQASNIQYFIVNNKVEDYSYQGLFVFIILQPNTFLRWDRNNTQRTNTSLSHYFPVHLGAVHMVRRYVGTVGMHSMYTITDQGQCVTGPPACPCSKTYSSSFYTYIISQQNLIFS